MAVGSHDHVGLLPPAHGGHKFVDLVLLPVLVQDALHGVELEAEQLLGQALVVDVEGVVFGAACHVVSVGGQTHEVLFVDVAHEGPQAVRVVDVPHLELAVGGRRHDVFLVEELDVRDGLAVALEDGEGLLHVPQVVVVDAVVGRAEGQVAGAAGVELDAAHVGLGLEGGHRPVDVERPQLDAGVVGARRDEARVHVVEVDAPAALLVLLEGLDALPGGRVPHRHRALVVAAGQRALVVRVPAHARDLGAGNHLNAGVVDVHSVSDHRPVVEHFDPLRHSGDREKFVIFVELDARDDRRVVEDVARVV